MPSKTRKQARAMAAAARNPEVSRRLGIPRSVAKEFHQADLAEGGGKLKKSSRKKKRGKRS